jgi:hypothetical protein
MVIPERLLVTPARGHNGQQGEEEDCSRRMRLHLVGIL